MPALCRRGRGCAHRPVAGVDAGAPPCLRRPPDQQRRRHHQLRPARARAADARVRSGAAWPARRSWSAAPAPARPLTTLDGKKRALDTDMLVIADAERASADRRRDGRRRLGGSAATHAHRVRERVVQAAIGARDEQASGPAHRGVVPLRARRRSDGSRRGDGTRAGSARSDRRRPPARRASSIAIRRRTTPRHADVDAQPASSAARACTCPTTTRSGYCASLGFGVRRLGGWQAEAPDAASVGGRHGRRLAGRGSRLARRHCARPVDVIEEVGRHYGFEHLPTTFPAVERAATRRPIRASRATRASAARLLGMGFSEAITFGFIEPPRAGAVPRRRPTAGDAGQSAVGEVHDAAAESAAGPGRRGEPQSPARPARRAALRNRHALLAARRNARRRRGVDRARHARSLERSDAATSISSISRAWSNRSARSDAGRRRGIEPATVPFLVEGRAAEVVDRSTTASVSSVSSIPALAERARDSLRRCGLRARAGSRSAHGTARRPDGALRATAAATSVGRARRVDSRRRHLVCRNRSWHDPSGGAASLVDVREFDRYQGKGVPDGKVSLSLRLTFQAPDRTLTDGEVQQAMDAIVASARAGRSARFNGKRRLARFAWQRPVTSGNADSVMATKTATSSAVEPIDRLEEKIKLLVSVIGRLRGEQSRLMEDNARLQREVEALQGARDRCRRRRRRARPSCAASATRSARVLRRCCSSSTR